MNNGDSGAHLQMQQRGQQPKVAQVVAQSVAEFILSQDLKPGDALPNEREMTELLGVARSTLREGLRLLETQGVISIRPGRGGGPVVREQRSADLATSMTLMLQSMRVSFGIVVEARSAIEPEIARMAALHCTDAQLEELRVVLGAMLATTNQAGAFRSAYNHFHGLLGEMTNNVVLEVVQATLRQVSEPLHEQVDWGPRSGRAAVQTHVRLFDAVEAGDAATAETELADHMHWYRQYFERRYPELLAQMVRWVPSA